MRTLALIFMLLSIAPNLLFGADTEYDIYLVIGQSNMAGRGYMIESDTLTTIEGVYILDDEDCVVEARNPLNQYSSIRRELWKQEISPALGFAQKMYRENGREILLVVNARGGSSMEQWSPNNDDTGFYSEAIRRTREAMKHGELKAVLWHQGCADRVEEKREKYIERLGEMVSSMRRDLGAEELYFVAGEIGYWLPNSLEFNAVLRTIVEKIPHSDYISAEGATMLNDVTDPHFSRDGVMLLGERYAEKVLGEVY